MPFCQACTLRKIFNSHFTSTKKCLLLFPLDFILSDSEYSGENWVNGIKVHSYGSHSHGMYFFLLNEMCKLDLNLWFLRGIFCLSWDGNWSLLFLIDLVLNICGNLEFSNCEECLEGNFQLCNFSAPYQILPNMMYKTKCDESFSVNFTKRLKTF